MNYQSVLDEVKTILLEQGKILRDAFLNPEKINFEKIYGQKDKNWTDVDIVTALDGQVERVIYDRLSVKFPELGFDLEEHTDLNDSKKEYICLVDPIDGTKYFAKSVPLFGMSVGIIRGTEPVLGVVYNPLSDQMYAGAEGIPSTLNGKPIKVSDTTDLEKAMISLDVATRKENWETDKDWMNKKITEFNLKVGRIRLLGQGALSCAWVASGGLDGFVSIWGHGSKPFDIAAGKALIKYAGGKVVDLKVPEVEQPRFVGGNSTLVDKICEILLN